MPLVTTAQMNALRGFGLLGMQTDVTIIHRVDADNAYSDDEGTWDTTSATVKAWLRSVPTGEISVIGGLEATIGTFRLLLPVGTSIEIGDRVQVGGDKFVVEDTTSESTYQVFLMALLRRAQ